VGSLVVVTVAIGATLFVKKGGMESDGTYMCAYLPVLALPWCSSAPDLCRKHFSCMLWRQRGLLRCVTLCFVVVLNGAVFVFA
jgi:hypothetical protein